MQHCWILQYEKQEERSVISRQRTRLQNKYFVCDNLINAASLTKLFCKHTSETKDYNLKIKNAIKSFRWKFFKIASEVRKESFLQLFYSSKSRSDEGVRCNLIWYSYGPKRCALSPQVMGECGAKRGVAQRALTTMRFAGRKSTRWAARLELQRFLGRRRWVVGMAMWFFNTYI